MSCWMSSSRVHTTFTGPSTCLAIWTARTDAVGLQPPAEAAADQMIVDDDLLERQAGGLCGHRLDARDRLGADPDFAAHPCGHAPCSSSAPSWRARGTEPGRSPRPWWRRLPSPCRRHRCSARPRLSQASPARVRAATVVRGELGMRTVVPFDLERLQTFLGGAHVIGHDGDSIVEPHDLAHALDGLGRRIVHALHAAAEHRRLRQASRSSRPADAHRCRRRPCH